MWKFCGKAQFRLNCPKLFGFHTRKLGEITAFYKIRGLRVVQSACFKNGFHKCLNHADSINTIKNLKKGKKKKTPVWLKLERFVFEKACWCQFYTWFLYCSALSCSIQTISLFWNRKTKISRFSWKKINWTWWNDKWSFVIFW